MTAPAQVLSDPDSGQLTIITGVTHTDRQIGPDDLIHFVCATCGRLATAFRGRNYEPDAPRYHTQGCWTHRASIQAPSAH